MPFSPSFQTDVRRVSSLRYEWIVSIDPPAYPDTTWGDARTSVGATIAAARGRTRLARRARLGAPELPLVHPTVPATPLRIVR